MRTREYTLITGGAGFIGSNLADTLLRRGQHVMVLDNLARAGVEANLDWLVGRHGSRLRVEIGDVSDDQIVRALVRRAGRVYHLAAQVAVTTSLDDPRGDLASNLIGTFNVLEAARSRPEPPAILFTSTNKVYGELAGVPIRKADQKYEYGDGRSGIDETAPLDFHSPYGCSKGAADQYVRDYARIYGVPTAIFRMSCIYGTRQFGTEDQGWVAHFARALMRGEPITIYGDGCQVRDVLWIDDLIEAMESAMERTSSHPGSVYNIGGGAANAVSIRTVAERLMEITGCRVPLEMASWRPGDQRVYVSDTGKAERELGWRPRTPWHAGLEMLVEWMEGDGSGASSALRTTAGQARARAAL